MTITEFLLARIEEDEAVARRVQEGLGEPGDTGIWSVTIGVSGNDAKFAHVAASPVRVLAECAAKRAIIAECRADHEDAMTRNDDTTELTTVVLYTLAAVYKDHPDYREEWA